jgi:hypothetical protein
MVKLSFWWAFALTRSDNYILPQRLRVVQTTCKTGWVFAEFPMLQCTGAQYLLRYSPSPSVSASACLRVSWEAATTQCDFHPARVRGIMIHFSSWDSDGNACCTFCLILGFLNLVEMDFGFGVPERVGIYYVATGPVLVVEFALESLNTSCIHSIVSTCEEVSKSWTLRMQKNVKNYRVRPAQLWHTSPGTVMGDEQCLSALEQWLCHPLGLVPYNRVIKKIYMNSDITRQVPCNCLIRKIYMNSNVTDAAGFLQLFTETSFAPASLWAFTFQFVFFFSWTQMNGGSHCSLFHSRWMTFTTVLLIDF